MNQTRELLLRRLESKGLGRDRVPHFFRCTMSLLHFIPGNEIDELNNWLHVAGWRNIDLDDEILHLMEKTMKYKESACLQSFNHPFPLR